MRKVTFGGANSLDNYFARPDNSVDWLMWSDEAGEIMKDYWEKIDTIVMGRKTWEVALQMAPKSGASQFGNFKTYVFSRSLESGERDGAAIINTDPGDFIRDLKEQPGKDICVMGGGDLAKSLFEAEVIDEIGFNIHPVLLGSGIPVFHEMKRQIDLELLECRPFKNGCVNVLYRVKHSASAEL
jgi:dihydrofolate reductase